MKIMTILLFAAILAGCAVRSAEPVRESASLEDFRVVTEAIPSARNLQAADCGDAYKVEITRNDLEWFFALFPPELAGRAGIDAIYICSELKSFTTTVPAATARIGSETYIYVNADMAGQLERALTHELFHALEFNNPFDDAEEASWEVVNPYERYLRDMTPPGGVVRYNPEQIPAFEPGFVSDYARFSAREDRAELFTTLLYSSDGYAPKEYAAMRSDAFMAKKAEIMTAYLSRIGLPGLVDNDKAADIHYARRVYLALAPDAVRTGPSVDYPTAGVTAGQPLAWSGYEKDGILMLYDGDFRRVYAPQEAIKPFDARDEADSLATAGMAFTPPGEAERLCPVPLYGGFIDPEDSVTGGALAAFAMAHLGFLYNSAPGAIKPFTGYAFTVSQPEAACGEVTLPGPAAVFDGDMLIIDISRCTQTELARALEADAQSSSRLPEINE